MLFHHVIPLGITKNNNEDFFTSYFLIYQKNNNVLFIIQYNSRVDIISQN